MLWSSGIRFSSILTVKEATSQHCCTPIHIQFTPLTMFLHAIICFVLRTSAHTHTHAQMMKCTVGYYALTHTHVDFMLKVLKQLSGSRCQTARPSGFAVIDVIRNQCNKQSHKTQKKNTCSFPPTNTTEKVKDRWRAEGQWFLPWNDQSRRSVTVGSSSANSDSTLATWVTGLPRRSRRFSLGQDASGWRSARVEISVGLG